MKTLEFTTICIYYYCREILRNPGNGLILLALFFFTYKLGTWAAWVMGL